jgi:hypothetical protein
VDLFGKKSVPLLLSSDGEKLVGDITRAPANLQSDTM